MSGGRRWAVLIGFNGSVPGGEPLRYAEGDARDLRDLLVHEVTGTFDPDDVTVLDGKASTWVTAKHRLREIAVTSHPSDVLLVYFAGHAYVPECGETSDPYLVTADMDPLNLRLEPDRGMRLSALRHDVFKVFKGTSFLVLDCCHAGAHAGALISGSSGLYAGPIDRHNALLACPHDRHARERDNLRHGVLTYHVLEALRGAAAGEDGNVTFAQMADYVANQAIEPTPGQFLHSWGPTTPLTRPATSAAGPNRTPIRPSAAGNLVVVACPTPLDRCRSSIAEVLNRVFRSGNIAPTQGRRSDGSDRLERVRYAVEAASAAVVDYTVDGYHLAESTSTFNQVDVADALRQLAGGVLANRRAVLGSIAELSDGRLVLSVPLTHHDREQVRALAVVDPARSLLEMGEPLGVLLRALWSVDVDNDPVIAEVEVLTAVRHECGRLPLTLYGYAFDLYRRALDSTIMVFEPVMKLNTVWSNVGVHSYEALARRDATSIRAPARMLEVPREWGDEFTIERDLVLLTKAIRQYHDAHRDGPWDDPKPVSVNVSVRSVLSDVYADGLQTVLAETGLRGSVILEISEQDPIEPNPDETWQVRPIDHFRRRLIDLAKRLDVHFAVDDFGVGYASLDRLAGLDLAQIKVDRQILHHRQAIPELTLVVKMAREGLDAGQSTVRRPVVIEGYDEDAPVPLSEIHRLEIEFVQGYITGEPASSNLRKPSDELRKKIAELVRGPR